MQCLDKSALVGRRFSTIHGDAVVVGGYCCYLRVPIFTPMFIGI